MNRQENCHQYCILVLLMPGSIRDAGRGYSELMCLSFKFGPAKCRSDSPETNVGKVIHTVQ
jgi:hypothetical protein